MSHLRVPVTASMAADPAGPLATPHTIPATSASQGITRPVTDAGKGPRWGSVNVEHGLAADAAVQQGIDRRLRLAP